MPVCCGETYNIAWFNRLGGWSNFIFSGVTTYEYRIGDTNTFKNFDRVVKYSEIKDVYYGVIATSGNITEAEATFLDGLRYSIQAFLYNEDTSAWDIPILLDVDSFVKFNSRDKLFDVRIRFIYATEKVIQTQ